jgi:endonuclease V-like protein UPF0215 family
MERVDTPMLCVFVARPDQPRVIDAVQHVMPPVHGTRICASTSRTSSA